MAYNFDESIVEELRKEQNSLALKTVYKSYYPMIVHLICANSGTEQEARDVFQEGLIVFYERVRQKDFVLTCKVKTYLYAVCRRLWLKRLSEKKKFVGSIVSGEEFPEVEEEMNFIDEAEKRFMFMSQSLDNLGQPCRSVIEDFYIHDLSMELISNKHGYTNAESAKNQKYKCLQRLKKLFFSYYNTKS
jgi:RNA polymerase sigma factor (sigma-70 family)